MARRLISSGTEWEALAGFIRAVVDGEWVFVSGCTGFDNETNAIADDAVEQTHKTFSNIEAALAQAGAHLEDVVRFTVIVPDRDDFIRIAPVLGEYFSVLGEYFSAKAYPGSSGAINIL